MAILDQINSPLDLKSLAPERLSELSAELRAFIVDTVSKTGGHLAPSLGVVDLSIALHYVFNTPNDKIIWDVSHQCYAHKILTGRRANFGSLRQLGGISGFTKREESPFDPFGAGHASTSISAALGIAKSFKKRGLNNRAIAVIGDGSMTGGLAFEGLNQAGFKTGNLIVVLNDNEMSISKNVGALSKFLSLHLHSKRAARLRRWIKLKLLRLMPRRGALVYKLAQRAEEVTAGFFTPGFMFESFGFHYIGPLDGHNLNELIRVFKEINETPIGETPILVHVLTKKGYGYKPAEENPEKFHGIGPFDKETGKTPPANGKPSYTQIAGSTILDIAKQDKSVIAITAAMPTGTGVDVVRRELPEQFYDVGIAEGHAVTFAGGLATEGFKPVCAIYSTFLQRAFDHILHDICLQKLPVTFAIDRAGLVGDDGPTHHGAFDLSFLRQIPNMVIMAPRDENMLQHMLFTAIYSGKPCAVRYPRGNALGVPVDKEFKNIPLGAAEIVFGDDSAELCILAVGNRVCPAVEAGKALLREGIKALVIDARFVKPLDEKMLSKISAKKWLTVEENVSAGGFGSAVNEWLSVNRPGVVILKILGLPDSFVEHGPQEVLRAKYCIDTDGIVKSAKELWTLEKRFAESEESFRRRDSLRLRTETYPVK